MYVNLDNEIDNGLHPTEDPAPCDCSPEHSEWDKLFIMLEDSQMREGMLLQATDDVLRRELRTLRAELGRLAGNLARPCAPAAPAEARLARTLDELLQASRDAGRRLARLEGAEAPRPEEAGCALDAVLEELRRTRADLRAVQGWATRRSLPAGKAASPLDFVLQRASRHVRQPPRDSLKGAHARTHTNTHTHTHT
ncbi:hypothetical protein MC885_013719, partial [Smutsia gigantea]